ncbi:hypothetical protein BDW71DRAFT_179666 [Aspergillus fruticulosus]
MIGGQKEFQLDDRHLRRALPHGSDLYHVLWQGLTWAPSGCLFVDASAIETAYRGTIWLVRRKSGRGRPSWLCHSIGQSRRTFFRLLIIAHLGLDSSRCRTGTSSTASFRCLSYPSPVPRSVGGSQVLSDHMAIIGSLIRTITTTSTLLPTLRSFGIEWSET